MQCEKVINLVVMRIYLNLAYQYIHLLPFICQIAGLVLCDDSQSVQ